MSHSSYEELTPDMREQVDATITNIQRGVWNTMDEDQEAYLREHISNTVATCLFIRDMEQAPVLEAVDLAEPPCW